MSGGNTLNLCDGELTETVKDDGAYEYKCSRCGALIRITNEGAYNVYPLNTPPAPALVTEELVLRKVCEFLDSQKIRYDVRDGAVCIYRDDMVGWRDGAFLDSESYDLFMHELRMYVDEYFLNVKIAWGFKDNDWISFAINLGR